MLTSFPQFVFLLFAIFPPGHSEVRLPAESATYVESEMN